MAKDETKRMTPAVIQADKESFAALEGNDRYAPANPTYAVGVIRTAQTEMTTAQQVESQAVAAAAAARDDAVAKEWNYHNLMLGAKDQVVAQFGRDSNEAQAVGLKKKSEYKGRTRKPKKSE
jgi:hypothetical protein